MADLERQPQQPTADETTVSPAQEDPIVDKTSISPIGPDKGRKNSLENHLMHRPDRAELVEKNILPASNAAPGLQAHQRELQKAMLEDKLNDKISHRPAPEELIKDGVLHQDPRSAEERYAEAIEDEYAKREGGA
ncbi:Myocardin-related transcription factor B [Paramyrothecium foliicola]|nr:Myocardin-related transcription factor B [Paramyrothecium foliicola]